MFWGVVGVKAWNIFIYTFYRKKGFIFDISILNPFLIDVYLWHKVGN